MGAQPAELGLEQAAVALVELNLFRVRVTETIVLTLLLKAWEVGTLGMSSNLKARRRCMDQIILLAYER
jgi:hypothetical protein